VRCRDIEALWDSVCCGDEPRRDEVLAHLQRCSHCQELYQEFEGVAYCLSCLPVVEPPPSLVPKIMEHIKQTCPRKSDPDAVTSFESPIGTIYVAFRESGITGITISQNAPLEDAIGRLSQRLGRQLVPSSAPQWLLEELSRFFTTWRTDRIKVDISDLTAFEQAVLRKAAEIPVGEVRSYGWIAKEIGHPRAARAVGQVMANNPLPLIFPCHRVVAADGALHQYGYGVEMKAKLLSLEGCKSVRL